MSSYVDVKCLVCGSKRRIGPGEIAAGDVPMCQNCHMPMVATKAVVRK
jgi:RNase P subunit RPR2